MFRIIISIIIVGFLFGCQAYENQEKVEKKFDFLQISFSETIRFPVELVLSIKPYIDPSCTIVQKIVPIYTGDEFISFRHQNCDSKWITVMADEGNVEVTWEHEMPIGEPLQFKYPPIIITKGNTKTPSEYLDDLYTTNEERRYCDSIEKAIGIWEIKNTAFSPIPDLPSYAELLADWEPPVGVTKIENGKLRWETPVEFSEVEKGKILLRAASEKSAEHYKQFDEQRRINRACDKLPMATNLFFEGEYVLTMPKNMAPVLDLSSIKYHKK